MLLTLDLIKACKVDAGRSLVLTLDVYYWNAFGLMFLRLIQSRYEQATIVDFFD
jgi:hypothetical protein